MRPGDGAQPLPTEDLTSATVAELQAWRRQIDDELRSRGHVRTASSPAGELMERVVANAYGGQLTPPGTKSADVALADGQLVQVKHRRVPAGDLNRHWAFSDLDFDVAVVINVDRDSDEIAWARAIKREELSEIVTPHAKDKWRLTLRRGHAAGEDITDRLREAYTAL